MHPLKKKTKQLCNIPIKRIGGMFLLYVCRWLLYRPPQNLLCPLNFLYCPCLENPVYTYRIIPYNTEESISCESLPTLNINVVVWKCIQQQHQAKGFFSSPVLKCFSATTPRVTYGQLIHSPHTNISIISSLCFLSRFCC